MIDDAPAERPPLLALFSRGGTAAQAVVPGLYAWAVTVAPGAWSRGGSTVSKVASTMALLALAAGVVGAPRWGARAGLLSLWGFVLGCGISWSATPSALGPARLDATQGLAGMLGWALYALATAAPALQGHRSADRVDDHAELVARKRPRRGDALYVVGGCLFAAGLEVYGWRAATPERGLLVRLVAIAAGLAVIGASADIATARHARRLALPWKRRMRSGLGPFVALGIALVVGVAAMARR